MKISSMSIGYLPSWTLICQKISDLKIFTRLSKVDIFTGSSKSWAVDEHVSKLFNIQKSKLRFIIQTLIYRLAAQHFRKEDFLRDTYQISGLKLKNKKTASELKCKLYIICLTSFKMIHFIQKVNKYRARKVQ